MVWVNNHCELGIIGFLALLSKYVSLLSINRNTPDEYKWDRCVQIGEQTDHEQLPAK